MRLFKDMPIQKKLMRIMFLISGTVLFVTCITFFIYEFYAFRKTTTEKLSTIGKIIAANSTAALAFANQEDAKEILAALKTEHNIVAAALYDSEGNLFSQYRATSGEDTLPVKPGPGGYQFAHSHLEGFQPVMLDTRHLGTLYLRSDLGEMYDRLQLYGIIAGVVGFLSFLLSYVLSTILQKNISKPVLHLAEAAKMVSGQQDYSVRAVKTGNDELGSLTDAFNNMLDQIQDQNQALQEFSQHLEEKVRDRTEELELVNKELEAFSYSISHDLRAPLRGVIGFGTLLEEDYGNKLDDEGRRLLTVIKRNALKMGHLIDDLLAFSRIRRQDIKKTNIAMTDLVREVIQELLPEDKKSAIQCIVHEMPDMKGGVNAMRQVWVNLVSNAFKYSAKKDEPVIEIGPATMDGQAVFYIRDNGVGFDEKYKNKLFKVFQRLHRPEEFEGTGDGLAIVEKIISKHGGKVWAEAEENKGACFYFSLPQE